MPTRTLQRRFAATGLMVLCVAAAGCKDDRVSPKAIKGSLEDSADQVMFGVRTLVTANGLLRAELFADTAYVFDDNTRYEMRGVKTHFFTTTGERSTVLTSREGTYNTRVNQMEARKNVVVVATDGRRLVTPQLQFMQIKNEIMSDSAFTMTEPNGRRLEGIGFTSDPDMRNIHVLRGASGKAGIVEDRAAATTSGAASGRAATPTSTNAPSTRAPSSSGSTLRFQARPQATPPAQATPAVAPAPPAGGPAVTEPVRAGQPAPIPLPVPVPKP